MIKLFFLLLPFASFAQFHVAIEANPDNRGETNIAWMNNYVVTYTNDNWQTKAIIKSQLTYQGFDDNGAVYYKSYYEKITFQTKGQAIEYGKKFKNNKAIINHDQYQQKKHEELKTKYDLAIKKLCFGCKDRKNEKPKPIIVY